MNIKNAFFAIGLCLGLGVSAAACAKLNPNTEKNIHSALQAKKEQFKACYKDALDRNRETQGTVGLRLDIAKETGAVQNASVAKTTIEDKEMNQCVATAASDITLADPPGIPVEGLYDIQFTFKE